MTPLPDDTRMGTVRLRVSDLERQVAFYHEVLGLDPAPEGKGGAGSGRPAPLPAAEQGRGAGRDADEERADGAAAGLGLHADPTGPPLLVLEHSPGAPSAPKPSAGLFHVALLLPTRRALAKAILRVRDAGWPFQGFADHAVSEAVYLADPEGNGLELYADRPESAWTRDGSDLHMTTEPLDLEDLLAEADGPARPLDERTVIGHVHLRVSSLEAAERFYVGRMGFDVMVRGYPGALFVAAGGYHHHIGLNEWAGRDVPRPPPGSRGLTSFDVVVPDAAARSGLLAGWEADVLEDQDGNLVRVVGPAG